MGRNFMIGGLLLAVCVVSYSVWYCNKESHLLELDDKANQQFAEKAEQLEIVGKPKAYIITHFGKPNHVVRESHKEILVYLPGPSELIWRSECKIGIDTKTGLVTGWGINSD